MSDRAHRILIEVCVGSVADVERAVAAGADRLELCSALELGGLTPSLGLVEIALQAASIPIVTMLRPRAGGFRYDCHEFAAMVGDAERFLDLGVAGIVFGVLDDRGGVDAARCRELVQLAGAAQTVFHRAVDFVADQRAGVDALIETGVSRVLTSGGRPTAAEGALAIRELVGRASGRIEIMPGGGINAGNVVEIVRTTGCAQIHVGAGVPLDDGSIADGTGIELIDRRFMQGMAYRGVSHESLGDTLTVLQNAAMR
jgi:copper homeostasis protein